MATIISLGIIAFTSLFIWTIYGAIYRLYFSPIAKFPGPKLAALTLWYEFYFNVILDGQWLWEIKRMHEQYGPIIRINPYELHIDDLEYYDELYAGSTRKREKYPWFVSGSGSPGSAFETIGHDLHRLRRNAVNPFFSKRSINATEPIIKSQISLLSDIFHSHFLSATPVDLRVAFSSLTLDIISDYCYGRSFGALTNKDLAETWSNTLSQIMSKTTFIMHFPIIFKIMKSLPDSLAGPVLRHHRNSRKLVTRILNHEDTGSRQNTIFHELRDSDLLPLQEKTVNRLADDGNILIGAGGETTAQTLAVLFYHLLENPKLLSTVRDEISTVDEDITWAKLERLPFLSAVITEALRISSVATTRLPRVAPDEDLIFKQWTIPAGTPTSMSYYLIHYSPIIFPSPEKFDPTRWITNSALDGSAPGDAVSNHRLDKYFVPFSKGTRICLGMNLAYAELFLTTAYVLRRFDFELFGTTKKDVEIKRDHFVAAPAAGSKGIRVIVTRDRGE
ncbi:hypothetical protein MFRU_025g00110 [Monilinia fructicola]|uniref:Cytochrome P450 n=1 Tax=Monilinia fructicola TaxID=38448 RepID=A0A5M9J8L2_MONFR|nr:hypothetical protein EYC84_011985 [Monilinia fructicola]KAG4027944.1 hypothetical protein MFRU_025g00110 [Monilinia fructicola]